MIRNIILPIFAIVLLASCSGKEKGNNSQNASTEAIPVKVQKLEKTNIANTVEQTANLIADEQVYYAPASTGRIKQIHVEVGDRIKKGEVLVEMDQTNLVQAEVQLENLKAEIGDTARIVKIDVDQKQSLATEYGIQAVPTFIIFKGGKIVWRHSGMISKNELKQQLLTSENI